MPETREDGVQANLDHRNTQGLSLDSSANFREDLESENLPIRETKASIARKRKITEMNPKDPVHCHYPKNKEHDHEHFRHELKTQKSL